MVCQDSFPLDEMLRFGIMEVRAVVTTHPLFCHLVIPPKAVVNMMVGLGDLPFPCLTAT